MNQPKPDCYSDDQIRAFLAESDLAKTPEGEQFSQHIEQCAKCRRSLENASSFSGDEHEAIRTALRIPHVASDRLTGVISELSAQSLPMRLSTEDATSASLIGLTIQEIEPWLEASRPGCLGRFADFDFVEFIGRGGMGIVFRAFDASLDRSVAVKLMLPSLAHDVTAKQRFFREARAIAAVRHPNVVEIHAISEHQGLPFLVTEFIEGHSLERWVREAVALDEAEVRRLGAEIAAGLAACQEAGVLHRDIKPSNVLINKNQTAKITDFGLAAAASSPSLTIAGQLTGTPGYLAPERLAGATSDHRSDLFSLGCLLYTLAAGKEPFHADTPMATLHQIADREPKSIRSTNPRISAALEKTIAALMSKRPEDRPQSARQVGQLLTQTARTPAHAESTTSNWIWAACSTAVLCALILAAAIVTRWKPPETKDLTQDGAARSVIESHVVQVLTAAQLQDAVENAKDDAVIEIRSDEFLEIVNLEIEDKSLTIRAAEGYSPTLFIGEDVEPEDMVLRIDSAELTLVGITIEDVEMEDEDYHMVLVQDGTLIAVDCRFETNSLGAGIELGQGTEARFRECQFFSLNGSGVRWHAIDGDVTEFDDCLHVGDFAMMALLLGDANLTWSDSRVVATAAVIDLQPEGGQLTAEVHDCEMQAADSIVVANASIITVEQFRDMLLWRGRSNTIFGHAVDLVDAVPQPEWTTSILDWAAENQNSRYDTRLFANELEWINDQLLDGVDFADLRAITVDE